VLVFVVAYNAERHIRSVFERVPGDLFNNDRVSFLCIDDASRDQGPNVLTDWVRERNIRNVSVMRNPVNLGYGGNQKLGYRIAVDHGYDFVILLHGDGQYAPELLPKFVQAWDESDADVVLGSRMHKDGRPREGGMPMYKWLGNRTLTRFQNALTGLRLSEYHTGYRGYSTRFLRSVPFEINTNAFHFDTEILLQAAHVKARFVEFAIPTHYGDEVCHVPGMRYAMDVVRSTLQFKLHQMGMICSLRYRNLSPQRYRDKTGMLYTSHTMALKIVDREKPRTLLDIGCGPGHVARECRQRGVEVTGIDMHEPSSDTVHHFHRVQLEEEPLPVDPFAHDMVLLLDVIEHLEDPERFMVSMRNMSRSIPADRPAPLLLVSTPNVAFVGVRLNLLIGRFPYAERGILDITHKRLFTRRTLRRMLRDSGYRIERMRPVPVPFQAVVAGVPGKVLGSIARMLAAIWPGMFAFQFLVECRPLPGVQALLEMSRPHVLANDPSQ
jgi:glycosyltransferase involved in cell wall biosynthesis